MQPLTTLWFYYASTYQMSAVMHNTQRHECIFINRAFWGRVAVLYHQSQRHCRGQGARPRRPHRLAAWKEEIWGLCRCWVLKKVTVCSPSCLYCVCLCCGLTVTGGADGCGDQLQKHQETWRSENWDGLYQPLSGEGRLWQCCEVGCVVQVYSKLKNLVIFKSWIQFICILKQNVSFISLFVENCGKNKTIKHNPNFAFTKITRWLNGYVESLISCNAKWEHLVCNTQPLKIKGNYAISKPHVFIFGCVN